MDIELVPTHSKLKPQPHARIEFPLIDEFFAEHWKELVEHDCENPEAEYCKNSLCFSFGGDEVPSNFKLDDAKSRSSLQHFIKNRGKPYVERVGDRQGHILPQVTKNHDGSFTVTIFRRCKAPEFRGRTKAAKA